MSQIVSVPDPVLRQVAKPIVTLDKKILGIIEDMKATLLAAKNPQGVGLAAPQIGIPLRIFLTRPTAKSEIKVFINPEITKFSQRLQTSKDPEGVYEGCLSIPYHYAPLERSMSVTVKYQTIDITPPPPLKLRGGDPQVGGDMVDKTDTFTGFPAHVIQHEMDHLNGILFIDRVLQQHSQLYRVEGKQWEKVDL
jgi:peptide deformylase